MKKVFWGFLLIFVNFNLTLNGHILNLFPTFAGYILLYQAAGTLRDESSRFAVIRPFAAAMAVYTGILWLGDLLGVTGGENWLNTILGLAATVVSLFVSWNVVKAIAEIEEDWGVRLNSASVRTGWYVLLVAQILSYAAVLGFSLTTALAALAAIAVGIIWFLAALWKCARLYDFLPPRDGGLGEL